MSTPRRTRGERNNNPLNLRYNSMNNWKGQAGHDEKYFCVFLTLQDGINAAARTLHTYIKKHDLHNIYAIISRWAPSTENDVEAYVKSVCRISGINRNGYIDYREDTIVRLMLAMARVESQMYLDREMVKEAFKRADR